MDRAALDYAALLADPCNGPLVSGPFGDGSGGVVSRFERDIVINNSGADTGAALVFIPALATVQGSSAAIVNDTGTITFANVATADMPGYNYLSTNAGQFRCLAACVQIYWPGSELNRQGIVSVGQFPADIVTDAVVSTSDIRTASPYVERMPDGMVELKWRPTAYETTWQRAANVTDTATDWDKYTALAVSAAGIPVSTGLRVRMVAVYEWIPRPGTGSGLTTIHRTTVKTGSLSNIIAALDRTGDWMYNGAMKAGHALASVARGVGAIASVTNGAQRLGRLAIMG
jgi:hypothetical protein